MNYFRLIRDGIDLAPLRDELAQHREAWDAQPGRQLTAPAQQHTNAIPLRGLRRSRIRGRRRRDVHESRYTSLANSFPQTVEFIEAFAAEQKGLPGRARYACLPPGKTVLPHIDRGEYYLLRDRYHLVIHSDKGSLLRAGGEAVAMQEGELWWFDNKALHDACNQSDTNRIHLIFDLLPAGAMLKATGKMPQQLLKSENELREHQAVQQVANAVALYISACRRPARWAAALSDAGVLELAETAPIAALVRVFWPGLRRSARRRYESAVAWSLALLDTGQIQPDDVTAAIDSAGGLDRVHQIWRSDRDRAIYDLSSIVMRETSGQTPGKKEAGPEF